MGQRELDDDLFQMLHGVVKSPKESETAAELAIGDSKELYKPGKGVAALELGVLACLAAAQKKPRTWRSIWKKLAKQDADSITDLPWYRDYDTALPLEAPSSQLNALSTQLIEECEKANCKPTQIESRVIFPQQFNESVEVHGHKATALSHTTLQLVRTMLQRIPNDEPVCVLCDKHGGRNYYGPLLNEVFPETFAMARYESRDESFYQIGDGPRRRELVFRAKADAGFLPSALASMVSKYLRELAMRAFNEFWTNQVVGLKPTAGYPVDAKRFKKQIEPTQKKLGIDDKVLWRCR